MIIFKTFSATTAEGVDNLVNSYLKDIKKQLKEVQITTSTSMEAGVGLHITVCIAYEKH
jgi:hypothetical protein